MSGTQHAKATTCYLWPDKSLFFTQAFTQLKLNHSADVLFVCLEGLLRFQYKGVEIKSRILLLPRSTQTEVTVENQAIAMLTFVGLSVPLKLLDFSPDSLFASAKGLFASAKDLLAADKGGVNKANLSRSDFEDYLVKHFLEMSNKQPSRQVCERLLSEVLLCESLGDSRLDKRVLKAVAIVTSDPSTNLSNEQIASQLAVSEHHFMRLFKRNMGVPFGKFRQTCRINAFINSYVQSKNLTQAAHHAGFFDLSHFSHTYKRLLGHSPSDFFHKNNLIHAITN